ncbi:uncharacterized protein N7459_009513 [Penicillium hispanicum]|uniref:uncharacterized protein n=1 Tax=Penicillium hispanicum TaxID=1080232 RepID=UPI002540E4DB|nr:uncharacterized protein N7459_009513 [Penicillium hispanicum]KAJ5570083.1 hypothetical protein N7459_009513 [Penicillium hispanicum]
MIAAPKGPKKNEWWVRGLRDRIPIKWGRLRDIRVTLIIIIYVVKREFEPDIPLPGLTLQIWCVDAFSSQIITHRPQIRACISINRLEMASQERITITCPTFMGTELENMREVLKLGTLGGKGKYTQLCEKWLENFMPSGRAFVVSSGTSALEMTAMLANIQPGDEIIVPSYTYVTTVNSFVLRGAVPVFVDIEDTTMNMDPDHIEAAVTSKTRAIIAVHYGGVACEMDRVMQIAKKYHLFVCEDAAMACTSTYHSRMLGTIGDVGCISFQEKKNFTAGGQGGALLVNNPTLTHRAEVIYEHGTNRASFMRGEVEHYQWLDLGLNATMSEIQAAFLYAQLQAADQINSLRLKLWHRYHIALAPLERKGYIMLPQVPANTTHNANVFWIRLTDANRRTELIQYFSTLNMQVYSQFMPLHSSPYGQKQGRFSGVDRVTSLAASQILLLPLHMSLGDSQQELVIWGLLEFFGEKREESVM